MSALRMFIPITKVNAARRLVYGLATAETEDRRRRNMRLRLDQTILMKNGQKRFAKSHRRKSYGTPCHAWACRGRQGDRNHVQRIKQNRSRSAPKLSMTPNGQSLEGVYTGFRKVERMNGGGRTRMEVPATRIAERNLTR